MKKVVFIGAGAVIVGIIGVIALTILNLGTLIKTAAEEYGPQITRTDVKLASADISFLSGSGTLNGFLLGNPAGFSMPSAIECDTIRVRVVKDSLTTNRIIIDEIYVDGPIISYEKKGKTDNFKTIINNIKKTVAGDKKEAPKDKQATQGEAGPEKKIQINNFIVRNGKINIGGSLLKAFGDQGMGISLPNIHLKDIGKEKDTSPAEAFAQILGELTGGVTGSVTQMGKQLKETLNKAVEGAAGSVGKAVEGAGGAAEGVGKAVKGLFGD